MTDTRAKSEIKRNRHNLYIKELMGHGSIRTTERYTRLAKRKILNITNPLDMIDQEGKECEEVNYSEKEEFNPKKVR